MTDDSLLVGIFTWMSGFCFAVGLAEPAFRIPALCAAAGYLLASSWLYGRRRVEVARMNRPAGAP